MAVRAATCSGNSTGNYQNEMATKKAGDADRQNATASRSAQEAQTDCGRDDPTQHVGPQNGHLANTRQLNPVMMAHKARRQPTSLLFLSRLPRLRCQKSKLAPIA